MTTSKAVLHGAGMLMGAGVLWAANAADVYHKGDSLKDEPVYMSPITWAGFMLAFMRAAPGLKRCNGRG
jgi:hypothetical protein